MTNANWIQPTFDQALDHLYGGIAYRLHLGEYESARVIAVEVSTLLGVAGRWDERQRAEAFSLAISTLKGLESAAKFK